MADAQETLITPNSSLIELFRKEHDYESRQKSNTNFSISQATSKNWDVNGLWGNDAKDVQFFEPVYKYYIEKEDQEDPYCETLIDSVFTINADNNETVVFVVPNHHLHFKNICGNGWYETDSVTAYTYIIESKDPIVHSILKQKADNTQSVLITDTGNVTRTIENKELPGTYIIKFREFNSSSITIHVKVTATRLKHFSSHYYRKKCVGIKPSSYKYPHFSEKELIPKILLTPTYLFMIDEDCGCR